MRPFAQRGAASIDWAPRCRRGVRHQSRRRLRGARRKARRVPASRPVRAAAQLSIGEATPRKPGARADASVAATRAVYRAPRRRDARPVPSGGARREHVKTERRGQKSTSADSSRLVWPESVELFSRRPCRARPASQRGVAPPTLPGFSRLVLGLSRRCRVARAVRLHLRRPRRDRQPGAAMTPRLGEFLGLVVNCVAAGPAVDARHARLTIRRAN